MNKKEASRIGQVLVAASDAGLVDGDAVLEVLQNVQQYRRKNLLRAKLAKQQKALDLIEVRMQSFCKAVDLYHTLPRTIQLMAETFGIDTEELKKEFATTLTSVDNIGEDAVTIDPQDVRAGKGEGLSGFHATITSQGKSVG